MDSEYAVTPFLKVAEITGSWLGPLLADGEARAAASTEKGLRG